MAANSSILTSPETQRAREQLLLDLRSLTRDAERLLAATTDELGEKAKNARHQLAAAAGRVKKLTETWRDRSVTAAQSVGRETVRVVRGNPYGTVAIAFGTGVLVGALLRRK